MPAHAPVFDIKLIAFLKTASLQSTSDQKLHAISSLLKTVPTHVFFTDTSSTPISAVGSIYTGANRSGFAIISTLTTFTTLTGASRILSPGITVTQDLITSGNLFFNLSIGNILPVTLDVYVLGFDIPF